MLIELEAPNGKLIQSWMNNGASVAFDLKTANANTVAGQVVGSGFVSVTPCTVKGTAKSDTLKVLD